MEATMAETQATTRARKRPAAKASERRSAPKVKATLLLSAEASQRLSVHAAMLGEDRSALVDKLINEHLRRFRVLDFDRPDSTATAGSSAA